MSEINAEQFAHDPIRSADDLVKYAPGVSRGGGQNVNIAPQIRGQNSELFQDAQRGFNVRHPENLNAYEGAEIVAGPSSVVFGPASSSGGYINYITKKPHFDESTTEVSGLFGTWVPDGGSYNSNKLTVDSNNVIAKNLAYRVSVSLQRADDYYINIRNNYNAFYGAVAWEPLSNLRIDWNAAYDDYYDFNIEHGWNRVTQQLVDSYGKQYAAGRATPLINTAGVGVWSPVFASGAPNSQVIGWQKRQKNAKGQYVPVGDINTGPLPDSTAATAGQIQGWVYDPSVPGNSLQANLGPAGRARRRPEHREAHHLAGSYHLEGVARPDGRQSHLRRALPRQHEFGRELPRSGLGSPHRRSPRAPVEQGVHDSFARR